MTGSEITKDLLNPSPFGSAVDQSADPDEVKSLEVQNIHGYEITFCILTLNKTPWLKRTLLSVRKYCPTKYRIRVLSQGPPDNELIGFLTKLDDNIELITSAVNTGCGAGRQLLSRGVTSPFIMMLDDDTYLAEDSIAHALKAFQQSDRIGAVSMPHYDLQGRMVSTGGKNLTIRNGVILRRRAKLNFQVDFMEVDDVDGGAMLYRTEMEESFSWDPQMFVFEDVDRSLQVISGGTWKQAIVPRGRVIHDRSWLGRTPGYERERLDGLVWRRAYRAFRAKWRLRFNMRSHFLFEIGFPVLTLTRCQFLISAFHHLIHMKNTRYPHVR